MFSNPNIIEKPDVTEVSFTNGPFGTSFDESHDYRTARETYDTQDKMDTEYHLKKPVNQKYKTSPILL